MLMHQSAHSFSFTSIQNYFTPKLELIKPYITLENVTRVAIFGAFLGCVGYIISSKLTSESEYLDEDYNDDVGYPKRPGPLKLATTPTEQLPSYIKETRKAVKDKKSISLETIDRYIEMNRTFNTLQDSSITNAMARFLNAIKKYNKAHEKNRPLESATRNVLKSCKELEKTYCKERLMHYLKQEYIKKSTLLTNKLNDLTLEVS